MKNNGFLVVCREKMSGTIDGTVEIYSAENNNVKVKYTESLMEAIVLQTAMLNGISLEISRAILTQETIDQIVDDLNSMGRDRLYNDEGECFIFVMFGRKDI